MASSSGTTTQSAKVYTVKTPSSSRKRFNVMKFQSNMDAEFKSWNHAKMERENNMKEFRQHDDDLPKFGAGSEFGREQREEARRKKIGINIRKYNAEAQPWLLNVATKSSSKRFRGIREGGVSNNSSWFIFTQAKDGAFEAFPVKEWYKFQPVARYKALSAEEAETEFERRDKVMNLFSVMYEKRLRAEGDEDEEEKGKGKKGAAGSKKNFLLSEMDDWMDDSDSGGSDEDVGGVDDDEDSGGKKKRKQKNKRGQKAKQKGGKKVKKFDGSDAEDCLEESDEFDDGAEHDYISSDSSDSAQEDDEVVRNDLAGVDNEDAIKKLLNSDEDEENEDDKKKEEEETKGGQENADDEKDKKKKKKKKKDRKQTGGDSSGESSASSDGEIKDKKKKKKRKNANSSPEKNKSGSPCKDEKTNDGSKPPANKKTKTDGAPIGTSVAVAPPTSAFAAPPPGSDTGVTEEAIRRYLMRKPMTTTELLQKFKSKKTGLNSEQLVVAIAQILKRTNPVKQTVKGKMYLSLKAPKI